MALAPLFSWLLVYQFQSAGSNRDCGGVIGGVILKIPLYPEPGADATPRRQSVVAKTLGASTDLPKSPNHVRNVVSTRY